MARHPHDPFPVHQEGDRRPFRGRHLLIHEKILELLAARQAQGPEPVPGTPGAAGQGTGVRLVRVREDPPAGPFPPARQRGHKPRPDVPRALEGPGPHLQAEASAHAARRKNGRGGKRFGSFRGPARVKEEGVAPPFHPSARQNETFGGRVFGDRGVGQGAGPFHLREIGQPRNPAQEASLFSFMILQKPS